MNIVMDLKGITLGENFKAKTLTDTSKYKCFGLTFLVLDHGWLLALTKNFSKKLKFQLKGFALI